MKFPKFNARRILAVLSIALPLLLILSAWRTYQSLAGQREVFLRSRVAAVAARLETVSDTDDPGAWITTLTDENSDLVDIAILDQPTRDLAPLWDGRELFREERLNIGGAPVFRAYIPFHLSSRLQLARIDIDGHAADFLTGHALHHLFLVALGGALIVLLTFLSAKNARQAELARQRQAELEHLAHIGEMSAVLAHEIRNPLGTIKGFAQVLGEKLHAARSDAGLIALLEPILRETSRLEDLVKDLLLYGRPAQPSPGIVDSSQIAAIFDHYAAAAGRDAGIDFQAAVSPFTLRTDLSLLEQILLNLFRNAVDASSFMDGSRAGVASIRFEAAAEDGNAVMRILDNGPGLTKEALQHLFEPFYTSKSSGTGLGLCISNKLARALGGDLRLSNLPAMKGGGAVAEVRLPLTPWNAC